MAGRIRREVFLEFCGAQCGRGGAWLAAGPAKVRVAHYETEGSLEAASGAAAGWSSVESGRICFRL